MLSDRQLEVLELIAAGLDNARIAQRLHISRNTVKFHVRVIYERLGVTNRVQAARALGQGLAGAARTSSAPDPHPDGWAAGVRRGGRAHPAACARPPGCPFPVRPSVLSVARKRGRAGGRVRAQRGGTACPLERNPDGTVAMAADRRVQCDRDGRARRAGAGAGSGARHGAAASEHNYYEDVFGHGRLPNMFETNVPYVAWRGEQIRAVKCDQRPARRRRAPTCS